MSVYLEEMLSAWNQQERNKVNENWRRIMATFSKLQTQINILAGGEVDELLERLNKAIDDANTAVQEAIDANNTATQEAIDANNTALQTALNTVSTTLSEVNQAIDNANTASDGANTAKQGALDATAQAQTAINTMQSLINNMGHRTTWNDTTQYLKNNMALYNGSTFIALQDNLGKTPPTLPTQTNAYWSLFAEKGAKGDKGDKGDKGADGTGVTIIGSLPSEDDLPPTGNMGDAYLIDGYLYVWNGSTWENVGKIQGPQGEPGPQGEQGIQGPPGQDADLTEINQKVDDLQTEVTEHLAQMASLSQVGHVQLSSEMNSNDETKAVTPKTVKLLNESKANTKQENWINLPELNGWSASAVAADKPRFFKDNFGIVHVYGTFKKNNSGSVHFTTLPVGYRPGFTSSYPLKATAKTSPGVVVVSEVTIENDGSLYCFTNGATEVYLDFSFVPN